MADKTTVDCSSPATGSGQPSRQRSPAERAKGLDETVQSTLGNLLRVHFDDLTREPIPDELKALLEELDRKQGKLEPDGGG